MVYLLIGFFILFISAIEVIKFDRYFSYVSVLFCALIMILLAGLRDGTIVGTDSPAYYANYQSPYYYEVEYGYKYLAIFFSKILDANYNVFLIFINFISLSLIVVALKRNSYLLVLPLLIYFSDFYLYYNFSGVRQALALGFTTFAIYHAYNRKYFAFLILMLFALSFHISAIAFVLAILVPRRKLTIKNYIYLILLALILLQALGYVIENNEYLSYKFIYYSEIQENADNLVSLYIVGIAKRIIILILVFIFRKHLFSNKRFTYFFNLYLLGLIIYISTYQISPDFGVRFSTYYTMLDMFLAGNMIYLCRKAHHKIAIFMVISLMVVYKIYTYANLDTYIYKLAF